MQSRSPVPFFNPVLNSPDNGNYRYITFITEIKPPAQNSVSELGDMKVYAWYYLHPKSDRIMHCTYKRIAFNSVNNRTEAVKICYLLSRNAVLCVIWLKNCSIDSSIRYLLRIVVYLFIRSFFFNLSIFSKYKSVKYNFSFENS